MSEPAFDIHQLQDMDYVEEKFSAGFKFNNPNETSACGCGESVDITPISELEIK